jgi:dihydroorotate dehydrogenase electron transfer subunit
MITAVGPFTRLVHEKRVGDRLWIRGPLGRGFSVPPSQRRLALVGGGYGVAPLLWLARSLGTQLQTMDVIIGAGAAPDLLYVERFGARKATNTRPDQPTRAFNVHVATEDGSQGQPGRVTDVLGILLERGAVDGIYACGPHGMLAALEALGREHNVPCQLSWEAYMRCGIGICGSCEHNGAVLCLDGPVLHHPAT